MVQMRNWFWTVP